MNLAATLSIAAAVVGAFVALLAWGFASAPGWREYRPLSALAFFASGYCACDVLTTLPVDDGLFIFVMRLQAACAALHVASWFFYSNRQLGRARSRLDSILPGGFFAAALASQIPGVAFGTTVARFHVDWVNATFALPVVTPVGSAIFVFETLSLVVILARYLSRKGRATPGAHAHIAALVAMLAAAVNDTLVGTGAIVAPFLLGIAFIVSVGSIGIVLAGRFVAAARELERQSLQLEALVADRTTELVNAQTALLRAEQLAALGQLSTGVAHEINNPAAAVFANVSYLRSALAEGGLPEDADECLADAQEAMERIAKIARQLLDSGRQAAAAGSAPAGSPVALRPAIDHAVRTARTQAGPRTKISVEAADDLHIFGDAGGLVQVLVNLVVNAAHAIPEDRDGHVEIRATREGERVRLEVIDDGAGMTDEVKRRIFEPFFTTKPEGKGTGLGLPVSLGIVRSMGGTLDVESRPGRTCMRLLLTASDAPPPRTRPASAPEGKRTMLLVDDDTRITTALARSLGGQFHVETASGVDRALACLREASYDVILSDVRMPAGGGRRLYEEIGRRDAALQARVLFFTGGVTAEADRAFLARFPGRVLEKPLVMDELLAAARAIEVVQSVPACPSASPSRSSSSLAG